MVAAGALPSAGSPIAQIPLSGPGHSPAVNLRMVRPSRHRPAPHKPGPSHTNSTRTPVPSQRGRPARHNRQTGPRGKRPVTPSSPAGCVVIDPAPVNAQQRKGEYSPFKREAVYFVVIWHVVAQQRKGEYSPFEHTGVVLHRDRVTALNKGRGNIPPSRQPRRAIIDHTHVRSTKEGGIFPLQVREAVRQGQHRTSLNKGRGNIPPSRTSSRRPFRSPSALNKGRGNIPPSSMVRQSSMLSVIVAQQRKGEYSPFKRRLGAGAEKDVVHRSTKEGGIFPLQARTTQLRHPCHPALNKGRGNIPPSRSPAYRDLAPVASRSTKEGGIFPGELHRWLQVNGHDDRWEHMQPTDGGVQYGSEAEFG